jgi:UDP-N-acetylmuramoyl-tripeptide--D-alanyl-D-alanine ligase
MIDIDVTELTSVLGARTESSASGRISQVMTDSRVGAQAPAVFFALRTARADGHAHVAAAGTAGAVVAVVERAISSTSLPQLVVDDTWEALRRLGRHVVDRVGCRVVAITGSYGKTTVKDLSAAALSAGRRVAASQASFNNELGVPLTMLSVEHGVEVLVAEAGARNAGDIALLGQLLAPDISVVTAVGPVHLETFGDIDRVAAEKSQLVATLRSTGTAVLNADDARVAAMAQLAPAVVTVSASGGPADLRSEDVVVGVDGCVNALVRTPWGDTRVTLPVPGVHHLTNALLALAVAGIDGVDVVAAADRLAVAQTSPSRSQLLRAGGVTILDDAYNASPPTMLGALHTLGTLPCDGRRWAVLGQMAELGPVADEQHRAIGRACDMIDELVVVGTAAHAIADGAHEGRVRARVRVVEDHLAASELVASEVSRGDVVLFKASRVAALDRAVNAVVTALGGVEAA